MVRGVLGLKDIKGLVLETFGAGNAPEDDELMGVLKAGVEMGIIIVSVTQCQVGSVSPLYAPATALAKAGVVFGFDMTTEAALTKLSCLLADSTLCLAEIRSMMSKSLRGELTEKLDTSFSHPDSMLPKHSSLSALGYAIANNNVKEIANILKYSKNYLLNEFDYSGHTPL
ncbi:hypothetical protein RUND412_011661, partial [Rhizina undulata]